MSPTKMREYKRKFPTFIKAMEDLKEKKCDVLIVAYPEVLGDDYEELVESLNRLAAAEIKLCIVPPNQRSS